MIYQTVKAITSMKIKIVSDIPPAKSSGSTYFMVVKNANESKSIRLLPSSNVSYQRKFSSTESVANLTAVSPGVVTRELKLGNVCKII